MDDTQQSRVSDAAAAATRKRRSSILKSQRPSRTPFSELEFNVATPTDTAKSRRVSFSKRTGVAEFVTNEATTTWKNFYEEHNKSLELSNNDSETNASRQPVGHLGKRIFDQQFEEVEAVDFISGLANGSLNNVNFSQQIASLDFTADAKLTAPQNKFELSAFTEQSKLFGNDFTAPSIGENSGRIDVNFSVMQQVEKDDLDEIEKDLERGPSSMGCHGPFSNGQNMSEYIEVDLNMTHVAKIDEDMSITDTVHSPVQDVSKSSSKDKKASLNDDWVVDKENIAINPYAAPCETNFAVNEEPDQVLVFDGKRLTLQPDIPEKDKNYRQTLLPNFSAETPQRKTIVLNVNDDLPNFLEENNMMNSKYENSGFSGLEEIKADEDEIFDTISVHRVDIKPKRRTIHDQSGNISMTQALPTNIISQTASVTQDVNATKRRTIIVFNESANNISMTKSVPVKLLSSSVKLPEQHRTVVYEDDMDDISMTQAVPSNILANENVEIIKKNKTIVFDSDEDNISMTQALTSNILGEKANKRKTIVFDDDAWHVSFTQALPANIILPDNQVQEKRRTVIYENDTEDISITQALPANVILPNNEANPERRQTVVFEDDTNDISVTQALPSNIIRETIQLDDKVKSNDAENIPPSESVPTNIPAKTTDTRRQTVVYENDTGNISITQAIPTQLIPGYSEEEPIVEKPINKKRATIVYDNEEGDISMTEAITADIIEEATNEKKTVIYDEDEANISKTLAISANDYLLDKIETADKKPENIEEVKEKIIDDDVMEEPVLAHHNELKEIDYDVYEQEDINSIQTENVVQDDPKSTQADSKNIDFEMSMTTAIPESILPGTAEPVIAGPVTAIPVIAEPVTAKPVIAESVIAVPVIAEPVTVVPVHSLLEAEKRKTVIFDNDNCDISMEMSQLSLSNITDSYYTNTKTLTVINSVGIGLVMTRPIPTELITVGAEVFNKKETKILDVTATNQIEPLQLDVIVLQASTNNTKPPTASLSEQIDVYSVPMNMGNPIFEESSPMESKLGSSPVTPISPISFSHKLDVEEVQAKLMASTTNIDKVSEPGDDAIMQTDSEERKELLVNVSEPEETDDKSLMAIIESDSPSRDIDMDEAAKTSTDSMFYVTKECEAVTQTDNFVDHEAKITKLKDKEEIGPDSLHKKLAELQTAVAQNAVDTSNRSFTDFEKSEPVERLSKNLNRANDTQDLLDLISNFTDCVDSDAKPIAAKVELVENTEHRRLSVAPNRQSIALSREDLLTNISMAQAALQKSRLTLDDSDSPDEDTRDASVDMFKKSGRASYEVVKTLKFDDESISETSLKDDDKRSPLKKSVFAENEYMKESKGKVIPTYLKDVSDGIKELMLDLVKPVSDYMPFRSDIIDKSVSENTSTHSNQVQVNLTTSSQIDLEYDLVSDPGVDLDKISSSASGTLADVPGKSKYRGYRNQVKFACMEEREVLKERHLHAMLHSHSHLHSSSNATIEQTSPTQTPVLVFDHHNPLNNILLAPTNLSDVHKYNPRQKQTHDMSKGNNYEVETLTTSQFTIGPGPSKKREDIYDYQKGDQFKQKYDQFSLHSTSTTSGRLSIDQSVEPVSNPLKDDEVNTVIAMKRNRDLLQASSSLTLVDETVESEVVDTKIAMKRNTELLQTSSSLTLVDDNTEGDNRISSNCKHSKHRIKFAKSPLVNVIEQSTDIDAIAQLSGISLKDCCEGPNTNVTKGKKRIYSPTTKKQKEHSSSKEVTPKPSKKMQKISRSPRSHRMTKDSSPIDHSRHSMQAEKDEPESSNQSLPQSKNHGSKSPKGKQTKTGQTITVQQLITNYEIYESEFKHKNNSEKKLVDLNVTPKLGSVCSLSNASFTSSKNLNSMKEDDSVSAMSVSVPQAAGSLTPPRAPVQGAPSLMDWHSELKGTSISNPSDIDAGVNVVAKIDMLPFMGSHECEWESKSPADTWSFRLLHGRLRLTTRLAHRHYNASRTRVLGDTPVLDIAVEAEQHDRKNPVATLCVRFACETMRHIVTHTLRNPCYAKDIPPLLRRCAAVARVALRWGRAMHDAKLHLAYTLDNDGNLSLKVANVRLRSVWEVTMRIELVVEDSLSAPWPRAGGVSVTRVLAELDVPDSDVRRLLASTPRDWGHAPRTIWQMFRYLKNKTRDDELLAC